MTFLPSALALAVWTIDALFGLASPSDPRIHPSGARFAYVYKGDIYDAPINGGAGRAVAKGSSPRWIPGTDRLAYLSGGQVYVGGRAITHSLTAVSSLSFDSSGNSVFYLAMEAGSPADPVVSGARLRPMHLYRQPVRGGDPAIVGDAAWHITSYDVAPDGKHVVCAVQRSPKNSDVFHVDLYEVDVATGKTTALVTDTGRDAEPSYSPDGRTIAFHSQGGAWNYFAARHVGIVPSGGGKVRYLTIGQPFDVFRGGNRFSWSADSRTIRYTAGRGVTDLLVSQDIESGKATVLAERIAGAATFSRDGRTAVFAKTSATRPPEIVRLRDGIETPVTHLQDGVAALPEIASRVVRWRSPDGLEIEGILWLPVGYAAGNRVPMIVELHGGPTGVALHAFPTPRTYPTQVFLQQGIAVFAPNFRGSCNYGEAFRQKNALSQGEGDYQDVMSGVDQLIGEGIADPDRLGVMGWSYGGYLTGAVIAQTNRFKAASIGAPAVDWTTYYGEFDGSKEVLWTYFGGTPWEAPESYNRHSTRSRLRNIVTPSLLQVGGLDINHNAEIYQALTDHKVPVEYVVYPREGHGIAEPAHQRDLMERNLRWFTERLR
ncbi:MAG: S9 family peptidase [Bryobacteraceae bacterium]